MAATATDPTYTGRFKNQDTASLVDAYGISDPSGIGNTDRLRKILGRRGVTFDDSGAITSGQTTSYGDAGPAEADFTDARRILANSGQSADGNSKTPMMDRWEAYKAELAGKKIEEYFNTNVQPTYDIVNSKLQELLKNPTFSGEELAATRSQMTSQIRQQELQRQKRVASMLGLAGTDSNSVAGAALANSVAQEADQRLTDFLRQYGLDVMAQERQNQAQELGLATSLTTSMAGAKEGMLSRNYDRVHGANMELSQILESLRQQDLMESAQKSANRTGYYGGMIGAGIGALGAAAGGGMFGSLGGGGAKSPLGYGAPPADTSAANGFLGY